MKPTLTIWQRIQLPFLWVYWYLTLSENKKPWHLVLKGMEKHECGFTVFKTVYHKDSTGSYQRPYYFMKCEHEGCNMCEPIE